MLKIVPNIWCSRNAEEVGAFYAEVFPGATSTIDARYPQDDLPDFQREFAGAALTVSVQIPGPDGLLTKLSLINAGNEFSPNLTVSFMLNFDPAWCGGVEAARALLDQTWARLGKGGSEMMALGEYPFSGRYGWVEDRFGVHWQLILTDPAGDPRPFVMPSLLFGGAVQNRAAEAIELYTSAFNDSAAGLCVPYGEPTGPATAEALMFGEFRVGEQWFVAMDSGVDQQEGFSCGVSFEVLCADQSEIDLLWESFSAVPEAEQCGWLADKFGVSWQIVPDNMADLMQRPGAFDALMGMRKIVIADF